MNNRWKTRLTVAGMLILTGISLLPMLRPEGTYAANYQTIRVNLSSFDFPKSVSLTAQDNYSVPGKATVSVTNGTDYTVKLTSGKLILASSTKSYDMGTDFTLVKKTNSMSGLKMKNPASGKLNYLGNMRFTVSGSGIRIINTLPLETYLYGVVPHEMSNVFPLEALKAQALAARSYAVMSIQSSGTYDLYDTTSSQVYRGYNAANTNSKKAVDDTAGVCITYSGSAVRAYYSASNGGQTEVPENVWGGTRPYFVMHDDSYDLANPSSVKVAVYFPKNITNVAKPTTLDARLETLLMSKLTSKLKSSSLSVSNLKITGFDGLYYKSDARKYPSPSRVFKYVTIKVRYNNTAPTVKTAKVNNLSATLNMRSGPATTYDVVDCLAQGETVTVLENLGDWCKVASGSKRGYVSSAYITVTGTVTPTPTPTATPTVTTTPSKTPVVTMPPYTTTDPYNTGASVTPTGLNPYQTYNPSVSNVGGDINSAAKNGAVSATVAQTSTPTVTKNNAAADKCIELDVAIADMQDYMVKYGSTTKIFKYRLYTIAPQADTYAYVATGYGHGVGMSQRGAQQMGKDGLSYKDIINFYFTGVVLKVIAPQPTPSPTLPPNTEQYGVVVLGTPNALLNVRSGAGSSYPVIEQIVNGTRVKILENSGAWLYVQTPSGNTGFVSADYIQLEDPIVPTDTPLPSGVTPGLSPTAGGVSGSPTISPSGSVKPSTSAVVSATPKVSGTPGPTATPKPIGKATVTYPIYVQAGSGAVNLRSGPSTNASVKLVLQKGVKVLLLQNRTDGWYYVKASVYVNGYVNKSNVSLIYVKGTITTNGTTMRSGPGTDYSTVTTLKKGTSVIMIARYNTWIKIRLSNGTEGFISKSYIKLS